MIDRYDGKIDGKDEAYKNIRLVLTKTGKTAKEVIDISSRLLASYMRIEKMTGGTSSTRLRVRSGALRASTQPIPAEITQDEIRGGVQIGTKYARVHIGPKGQKTTIRPKKAQALTIPLPAALTRAGVVKGSARSGVYGETFIRKTAKGQAIIFGKTTYAKGPKAGKTKGGIVPLFLLLKSVTVPARIHPEELLRWIIPKISQGFKVRGIRIKEA